MFMILNPLTHVPLLQVYVWIYDPVHFKTFAMGLILGESKSKKQSSVEEEVTGGLSTNYFLLSLFICQSLR